MKWLDISSVHAQSFTEDFWNNLRNDLNNGGFWADEIRLYKDQPIKRLKFALENLPLPAAFREAIVAIRSLIRSKIAAKGDYSNEISLLYWLAAIESFSVPYSEVLKEPGFNILESIPGEEIKSLPFSYQQLGYQKLNLLNKTDIKWIIAIWGEPLEHTTLNVIHNRTWRKYEFALSTKRSSNFKNNLPGWSNALLGT